MKPLKNEYITNQNDMYLYFEIINQAEPDSIIDIGMFLKRIGAISRQVKNFSIPDNIVLDGIDFMDHLSAKIYESIYNNIGSAKEFVGKIQGNALDEFWNRQYDLAFMLRMESAVDTKSKEKLWKWVSNHAHHAVVSGYADSLSQIHIKASNQILNVDNDIYSLIEFDR